MPARLIQAYFFSKGNGSTARRIDCASTMVSIVLSGSERKSRIRDIECSIRLAMEKLDTVLHRLVAKLSRLQEEFRTAPTLGASLPMTVHAIVSASTEEEVARVDAKTIVAFVADAHPCGDRPICDNPSEPVSAPLLARRAHPDFTSSSAINAPRPEIAAGVGLRDGMPLKSAGDFRQVHLSDPSERAAQQLGEASAEPGNAAPPDGTGGIVVADRSGGEGSAADLGRKGPTYTGQVRRGGAAPGKFVTARPAGRGSAGLMLSVGRVH